MKIQRLDRVFIEVVLVLPSKQLHAQTHLLGQKYTWLVHTVRFLYYGMSFWTYHYQICQQDVNLTIK